MIRWLFILCFFLFWPIVHTNYNHLCDDCTVVWINQKSRRKYWATRSSVRSFARTAPSFARSLAPLPRSLALHYLLRSRAPQRSLIRSVAHSAHSLAREKVNDWMAIHSVFFSLFWPILRWRQPSHGGCYGGKHVKRETP